MAGENGANVLLLACCTTFSIGRLIGDPYHAGADNCENDMTFAQTGVPSSPTVNTILGLGALVRIGIFAANQAKPRPRRRRR